MGPTPANCHWVHVADRSADTFEFLARNAAHGTEFVVRPKNERVIHRGHTPLGEEDYLHCYARSLPLQGRRQVAIAPRPGQPARTATVAVAFAPILLALPHVRRGHYEKRPLPVWVVCVREVDQPAGVEPLEWILLTNCKVATLEDAGTNQLV